MPFVERRQGLMGGTGAIVLVGAGEELLAECFALADRCESAWSRFLPDSDVTRLNWSRGRPIEVDPLTIRLLESMIAGAELTAHDYNPTILPDLLAAGYTASTLDGSRITTIPAECRTAPRLQVTFAGDEVRIPAGVAIDAGGIGKGLAADLVVEFALAHGAWGALAEFGGDVVASGIAPTDLGWCVAVENAGEGSEPAVIMRVARGAIVTSSQARRRWTRHGSARHHLIDPATGECSPSSVVTATVIAATGARAEVIAKSAFLREPSEFLDWVPSVGAAALLLDDQGTTTSSENWGIYR
jgi:thiamine biosynthesis lipoprotein